MRPILFTGAPGIGKSTLLCRLADVVDPRMVSGVISGEIRIEGKRQGFSVRSFGGAPGVLSSPDLPGEPRFGTLMPDGSRRLGLSLDHLDQVVCAEVESSLPNAKMVILDEIGPMQVESKRFRRLVQKIFAMSVPVFASVGLQNHEWMAELRNDKRYPLIELTYRNRDLVAELLISRIREVVG